MKYCFSILFLVLLTCSASAQWKKITVSGNRDLYDVQILGATAYMVGFNSALFKSTDSGKTWSTPTLTIPNNIRSVYFINKDTGFVIGENARIQKTYNGAQSWSQKYVRTAAYGYDICFNGSKGIAVGADMLAVSSNDFGETWFVDTTMTLRKNLNSVCIMPGGMCWAVGDSGYILSKHINRRLWTNKKYNSKINFSSVRNFGDSILIVSGGIPDSSQVGKFKNIVLISKDSGKTWNETSVPEMKLITASFFFTPDTGFLAGSSGLICKIYEPFTKRGLQIPGTASTFNSIDFSGGIGLVVGDGSTIYRTSNFGGFALSSKPQRSEKIKVYPNPMKGILNLSDSENILKIEISDLYGRAVPFVFDAEKQSLEISEKGMLFIHLYLKDGSAVNISVLNQG